MIFIINPDESLLRNTHIRRISIVRPRRIGVFLVFSLSGSTPTNDCYFTFYLSGRPRRITTDYVQLLIISIFQIMNGSNYKFTERFFLAKSYSIP